MPEGDANSMSKDGVCHATAVCSRDSSVSSRGSDSPKPHGLSGEIGSLGRDEKSASLVVLALVQSKMSSDCDSRELEGVYMSSRSGVIAGVVCEIVAGLPKQIMARGRLV